MAELVWESTPPTSHIHSFAWDAEEGELHVMFKDEKSGGVSAYYVYPFGKETPPGQVGAEINNLWYAGKSIVNYLRISAHPYGDVLYPEVVKPRTPVPRKIY